MQSETSIGLRLNSLVVENDAWPTGQSLPLAILSGEGIGPELITACLQVLEVIEKHSEIRFELELGGKIGKEALAEHGSSLTDEVVAFCHRSFERGAPIFCGPGGGRFVYLLRSRFDIYCKFVPIQPMPALIGTGPMSESAVRNVDVLLVRDNAGGVYQGAWKLEHIESGRRAHHSFYYDESQVRRIINLAVAVAQQRRHKLCVVHKPGGTPAISELWVEIAKECAEGSGVELRFLEVDTAAYLLLAEASTFDVVVTPNMFGDVLADAAATLLGSRGMSFSWNVNHLGYSVYQTGHGAAYDLAGRGVANPLGQIQSLSALLRESFGLKDLACSLLSACNSVLESGCRTADISCAGGSVISTQEMGAAVAARLAEILSCREKISQFSEIG